MRTILFTGKGGVGKTTISAATALVSARRGHRTLIISTDVAHSLAEALDLRLGNQPQAIAERLYAAELDTAAELERYWGDIKRRIASALRDAGVEATAAGELAIIPGLDEILALTRIKSYYDEGHFDVLIIDSAPTGAAMRLLAAPDLSRTYAKHLLALSGGVSRLILPAIRSRLGLPISERVVKERISGLFDQVEQLRQLLTDHRQTSVRLVLNPDRMSLRETQRAYTYACLFGLSVDALFVNRILPEQIRDPYFYEWHKSQKNYRNQIHQVFAPLPVYEIPLLPREVIGSDALQQLGEELYGQEDPADVLSNEQPLRIELQNGSYVLDLRVAGVSAGNVELEKHGDELYVKLGAFRRTIMLPQYVAGLEPSWARIEQEHLRIAFEQP